MDRIKQLKLVVPILEKLCDSKQYKGNKQTALEELVCSLGEELADTERFNDLKTKRLLETKSVL